jgi:hypothetical protein
MIGLPPFNATFLFTYAAASLSLAAGLLMPNVCVLPPRPAPALLPSYFQS